MARRRNKGEEKQTARQRIDDLLAQARREALGPDDDLADRAASVALAVARRYQAPLRPSQKVQVCRACATYRRAATSRVRVHRGRIVTTCLACRTVRRRPLGST